MYILSVEAFATRIKIFGWQKVCLIAWSSLLKLLIAWFLKVKGQIATHVIDPVVAVWRLPWSLDQLSKKALITWFNLILVANASMYKWLPLDHHHKHFALYHSNLALPLNLPVVLEPSGKTLCGLQLNPVTRLDGVQIQLCNFGHWSREAVWVRWGCMLWCSPSPQPPPHTSSTNRSQSQEHFQLGVFHLANLDFPTLTWSPVLEAESLPRLSVLIIRYFISIFLKIL